MMAFSASQESKSQLEKSIQIADDAYIVKNLTVI